MAAARRVLLFYSVLSVVLLCYVRVIFAGSDDDRDVRQFDSLRADDGRGMGRNLGRLPVRSTGSLQYNNQNPNQNQLQPLGPAAAGGYGVNNRINPDVGASPNRQPMLPQSQQGPDQRGGLNQPMQPVPVNYGVGGAPAPQPQYQQRQPISAGQPQGRRPQPIKISERPECANDVKTLCSSNSLTNNFAVLDCLQSEGKGDDVSKICQNFIWNYKRNLTTDIRFDSAAAEVCKETLQEYEDCNRLERGSGHVISCLIEHKDNVTSPNCRQFLTKMASIVFSDYRLIHKFTSSCNDEIIQFKCGRLHPEGDDAPHSQGKTVECLSEKVQDLGQACKHEILRIAELQADDYHMDRPLFYACRDDRERFCHRTKSGSGKIFKCLYRHKFEKDMSSECRKKLVLRQKLMQEDYKVNRGLAETCRRDIKQYKCTSGDDSPHTRTGRMAHVLLCLEGAMRDGNSVSEECIGELKEMRRSLLEDYEISPDLVKACHIEIAQDCGGGLQREGKTLHCLMDLARPKRGGQDVHMMEQKISDSCRVALENVLTEADVGEDYRMDPALAEACQPVVEVACRDIKPGDARVIACLMEKMGTSHMTDECEERLLEIQYFVSRDFKLDTRLFKYCHKDAADRCSSPEKWFSPETSAPEQAHLVFSCLYRHLKFYATDPDRQLSRSCSFEVKRIMRQRAVSIDLEPRIEIPCMADLGRLCSDNLEKGQEVECLQDNYDDLDKDCQLAVGNYTEDEDRMPELDRILMKSCTPMLKTFCADLLEKEETGPGEVMECLIQYKSHSDMNRKCASGIEHHQMVSLKDYSFSFKFKEACKGDVLHLCPAVRKKSEVIKCLSEQVRNDTLLDREHKVSRSCRKQLRFELLQRSENIELDPDLKESCQNDVEQYCHGITPGRAQVVECLKNNQKDLSVQCRNRIFKREVMEAVDNRVDFKLMTSCKRMIKRFCHEARPSEILTCLQHHRDDEEFEDSECRNIIASRQIIHAKDYRLNPSLAKSCQLDIPKFCTFVLKQYAQATDYEGKIINCLKIQFPKHRLSRDCDEHIRETIKESALDYRQDPILAAACKHEIKDLCLSAMMSVNDGGPVRPGQVEECLKNALASGKIHKESQCLKEVVRLLSENQADVHVDPLLHRACALDLKHFCYDVPSGEGRLMSCLLSALDDKTVHLQTDCRKMLQERVAMWEYAAKVAPPETFMELYYQVTQSKAKNFFVSSIFVILGVIFIGGLCCGRVTKRVRAEIKNK